MPDAFKHKVDCFGVPSNLNIFLVLELFLQVLIVIQKLSLPIRSHLVSAFLRFYNNVSAIQHFVYRLVYLLRIIFSQFSVIR